MADTETKPKGKPGRKPKGYDETTARQVEQMAQFGLPHDQICAVVDMSKHTLYKYYSVELTKGAARANLQVAKRLYIKAVDEGDTTALIFWAKCRMRWSTEVAAEVEDQAVPSVRVKVEDAGKKPAKAEAKDAGADA